MIVRELVLLSPHRFPTEGYPTLGSEESACFLNGWSVLWHPLLVRHAIRPPRIESTYNHIDPKEGEFYVLPEEPSSAPPDDWESRVRLGGAVTVPASTDRAQTSERVCAVIAAASSDPAPAVPGEVVGMFFAIGLGYAMIDTIAEAMQHENTLAKDDFWKDVQEGAISALAGDTASARQHLEAAAGRLQSARESLYPVSIYWLDLCLLGDKSEELLLPRALEAGTACNVLASARALERLRREQPDKFAAIKSGVEAERIEVCGGLYAEHDDAELPIESQLWNLKKGQETYKELLGHEPTVFVRARFGMHPHSPLFAQSVGLERAVLLAFDDAVLPTFRGTVVNWPSADGKQVQAYTRKPFAADEPQTYFQLAYQLRHTIAEDHAATVALLHRRVPAAVWYDDLLELSRLAPVLGSWVTLSSYLSEVQPSEYAAVPAPDDFRGDVLVQRVDFHVPAPISFFTTHFRQRRHLDVVRTLAALNRGIAGRRDSLSVEEKLAAYENRFEVEGSADGGLAAPEQEIMQALADRLLARGPADTPGYLLVNACSYARRTALELPFVGQPFAPAGPLKAAQFGDGQARLVVEVPALGFAWIPANGPPGASAPVSRMKLADTHSVRNEFFEAEIDPDTGGIRAFRDLRTRTNRLAQQLVYNPGSTMRARSVRTTSTGPALGELWTEGDLIDDKGQVLARYRQRLRAWLGRSILDLRIEIEPLTAAKGYAWHAYYGARFAWRDERAMLLRSVHGQAYAVTASHPETLDYLEVRQGRQNGLIFTGGLPFHQRNGNRIVDVLLVVEGEECRTFELGLGLDRECPFLTAQGMITPVSVLPVKKGPPHVGASGWLFNLDVPNLVLSSMSAAADGSDSVTLILVETHLQAGQAELRCPRNPVRATLVDARGKPFTDASIEGDLVRFDFSPGDLVFLQIDFE